MIRLRENEKIELVIRKHWFVMASHAIFFVAAVILVPIALTLLPSVTAGFDQQSVGAATNFFLSIYVMGLLAFLFLVWTDYYLDMWIITNQRVIDVEQKGLFYRDVAEIPIQNVQDVTMEVRGVVQMLLKFGTIRIQTAGEREFYIQYVPHLYKAKDIIIKYAELARKSGG